MVKGLKVKKIFQKKSSYISLTNSSKKFVNFVEKNCQKNRRKNLKAQIRTNEDKKGPVKVASGRRA